MMGSMGFGGPMMDDMGMMGSMMGGHMVSLLPLRPSHCISVEIDAHVGVVDQLFVSNRVQQSMSMSEEVLPVEQSSFHGHCTGC